MSRTFFRAAMLLAALALLLSPLITPASAQATKYEIDKPHCTVSFKIRHIYVFVHGKFREFSGDIRFDPKDLAHSSIAVAIQVASVDTGIEQRDAHLRTADFFDAAKYPEIKFASQKITHLGGNEYLAQGKLTVKGVSRDFDLPFKFLGEKSNPMDKNLMVAGFETSFSLDRLVLGVGQGKFYKMGVVGKDVIVNLDLELIKKP